MSANRSLRLEALATALRETPALQDALLPPNTTVDIEAATFQELGDGTGTVEAAVTSGGAVKRWHLLLVYEAGAWRVLSTKQIS